MPPHKFSDGENLFFTLPLGGIPCSCHHIFICRCHILVYTYMYIPTHFLTNCRNWSGLLTSEHVLLPAMNLQSWSRLAWFFLRDAWAILPERSNTPGCQYRIFVLEIKRSNLMRSKIWCEGRLTLGVEACTISNKGKGKSSTKTSSFENTTSMDNLQATRKNQLISILWDNHADNHNSVVLFHVPSLGPNGKSGCNNNRAPHGSSTFGSSCPLFCNFLTWHGNAG